MRYQLRWLDEHAWTVKEETVEAASQVMARTLLQAQGKKVLSIRDLGRAAAARSLPQIEAAEWCRELRLLVAAGMTVVEAIQTLQGQAGATARGRLLSGLCESLAAGQSLSVAMTGAGAFPSVLIAGVIASERTGALLEALDDYLRYHELVDQLRRKLISAAIYPLLVLGVGAIVVLFLLWFVVPRFSAAYADMRGSISGVTQGLVLASNVLRGYSVWIGWALATGGALILFAWRRGVLLGVLERAAETITPLRATLDEFRRAKLFHAMALMFRGGFTLPDALERCTTIGLGGRWAASASEARERLIAGHSVAVAFANAKLTDLTSERLLQVGERTGSFAQVLQAIADRHSSRFATIVERATRLAEPLLLLLVAAVVGGVVVLMYLPIFDLASSLR